MKKALSIIGIIIIVILVIYNSWLANTQCVTKSDFKEYRTEFNERLNKVDENLDSLKKDCDTLKKGQKIIYDEVKKNNTSFFEKLFK